MERWSSGVMENKKKKAKYLENKEGEMTQHSWEPSDFGFLLRFQPVGLTGRLPARRAYSSERGQNDTARRDTGYRNADLKK